MTRTCSRRSWTRSEADRQEVRRPARRHEGHRLPRDRGPFAHGDVRHHRRGAAGQQEARCRAAQRHPPGGAVRLPVFRPARAVRLQAGADRRRADGRGVSGTEERTRSRRRRSCAPRRRSSSRRSSAACRTSRRQWSAASNTAVLSAARTRRTCTRPTVSRSTSPSRWRAKSACAWIGRATKRRWRSTGDAPARAARRSSSPPSAASCRRPTIRPNTAIGQLRPPCWAGSKTIRLFAPDG